jgi:hypothetical protein
MRDEGRRDEATHKPVPGLRFDLAVGVVAVVAGALIAFAALLGFEAITWLIGG